MVRRGKTIWRSFSSIFPSCLRACNSRPSFARRPISQDRLTVMIDATALAPDELLATLAAHADAADAGPDWPAESWAALGRAGVLEWAVPSAHGGRELDAVSILAGYERIASACLTTAFILSQRDGAVRRIRDLGGDDLRRELLRPLACGGRFATVGISQLTTSR